MRGLPCAARSLLKSFRSEKNNTSCSTAEAIPRKTKVLKSQHGGSPGRARAGQGELAPRRPNVWDLYLTLNECGHAYGPCNAYAGLVRREVRLGQ